MGPLSCTRYVAHDCIWHIWKELLAAFTLWFFLPRSVRKMWPCLSRAMCYSLSSNFSPKSGRHRCSTATYVAPHPQVCRPAINVHIV